MDWITGIQRAIDFIEEHIEEPIDFEEAAKRAYSSSFHFQRVFGIMCGYTVGDYIRMRRLSLAGAELASSDAKIIDVALKYGYDTPESFSRAFARFHGIKPSQARNGGNIKSFSRISVKLILDGGNTMDYRIERKEAFELIAKKKRVSCNEEMTSAEISGFWKQCGADGTMAALCKYGKENVFGRCVVGASFGNDATESEFPYAIGVEYNGAPITDEGFKVEKIPAHTYAVFKCVGEMPAAFQRLYKQVYTEFFPQSEWQPCGGTDFEAYPSSDVTSKDYVCELWIAVESK